MEQGEAISRHDDWEYTLRTGPPTTTVTSLYWHIQRPVVRLTSIGNEQSSCSSGDSLTETWELYTSSHLRAVEEEEEDRADTPWT